MLFFFILFRSKWFSILKGVFWVLVLVSFLFLSEIVLAQVKDVPRKRTVVISLFESGETNMNEYTGLENSNPYSLGALSRVKTILNKTIYEFLYLYNHNTGEEVPWLAESYEYNSDFTEITVTLRKGVEWSDGEPFTARDFAFTIDILKKTPTLVFSANILEWIKEIKVVNGRTTRIILNKPNPRFFFVYFIENSGIHIPILPEHIWKDQDPEIFSNVDSDKGWPIGTGPYKLVSSTASAQIYDRRNDWWAAKTGFQKLPMPERIIVVPPGGEEVAAQQLVKNELDVGPVLLKSTFEVAKRMNNDLVSWNRQGPQWGAPDACLLSVGMNTKLEPFNNRDVRWAVNHAIDRDSVVNLAYEGGVVKQVIPFSSFGALDPYRDVISDLIAKHNPDDFDLNKTNQLMTKAGYKKDRDGFWVGPEGKKLTMNLNVPSWLRPLGMVVAKQLKDAGFDFQFKLYAPDLEPFFESVRTGQSKIWILVHCGSSWEPYGTLQHFHSKWSAPIGKSTRNLWANSRYENPDYDRILDRMETLSPSATNPEYIALTQQAIDIYLRDLPQVYLSDEMHVLTFNEHYWTGWAGEGDPYVAPYSLWAAFLLELIKIEPTQ